MAKDFLAAQNIMSEIDGARDYTSHVIGGLSGTFKLKVNSEDSTKAIQLLNELESASHQTEISKASISSPVETASENSYLKKSIILSLMATVILPIIFNVAAFLQFKKYLKLEPSESRKKKNTIIFILLQLPATLVLAFYLKSHLE